MSKNPPEYQGDDADCEIAIDIYRRAFNMAEMALKVISVYGDLTPEQWLHDHGVNTEYWRKNKEHYEYLRTMDYEVASMTLMNILDVLAKLPGQYKR